MKNLTIITFFILLLTHTNMYSNNNDAGIKKSWFRTPDGAFWGNFSFKDGKYKKALEQYLSSEIFFKKNDLAKLYYNIGNVYYKLNDNKKASQYYEDALILNQDDKLKSMIYYNYGLNEFKNQNFSQAADYFKKSLRYNPNDNDARYNYAVCSLLKNEIEKNKNNIKQDNKENNKKNEQEEQQNQQQQKEDQQNSALSKDDIDKLLKALEDKERKENYKKSKNQNKGNNTERTKYW